MTTAKAVEDKLVMQQKTNNNAYMTPTKNMKDWYKDELLFVRKVTKDNVVVYLSLIHI